MVTTEEASDILWKHWGVAAIQVETPTSRNVHFVRSAQGNSVLRTNPGWDGPSPPELIVRFVDHLSSSRAPVPKIVPTLNGEFSVPYRDYTVSLESLLPGQPLDSRHLDYLKKAGKVLASIHNAAGLF